jgi:hypothetical protein
MMQSVSRQARTLESIASQGQLRQRLPGRWKIVCEIPGLMHRTRSDRSGVAPIADRRALEKRPVADFRQRFARVNKAQLGGMSCDPGSRYST